MPMELDCCKKLLRELHLGLDDTKRKLSACQLQCKAECEKTEDVRRVLTLRERENSVSL
jgi:hypothetical protein